MSNGVSEFMAENGVLQIYPNNPRIPSWVMGFENWKDRQTRPNDIKDVTGSGANTVLTLEGQVRYGVKCKPGANENIERDHSKNLARGWSDTPDDWVSIEQTGFIEITEQGENHDIQWFGPSGRHPRVRTPPGGCMGSTYKGFLHSKNGKNRMAKEYYHVNYAFKGSNWEEGPEIAVDTIKQMNESGKKVGFKWVNMKIGDKRRVEIWVDIGGAIVDGEKPVNKWQLIRIREDNSDWWPPKIENGGMDKCKCDKKKQVILWGAPTCVYRWDNQTGKLSLATVQEITPPIQFHEKGDIITAPS